MEVKIELLKEVLRILAQNPGRTCTLEALTMALIPNELLSEDISSEREYQAKVLNALISLENDGMIVLNSDTDESSITFKGHKWINL